MPTPPPLAVKFLRYIDAPSMSDGNRVFGLWLRILYEFWGFPVNGTNDLKHPGGFPTGSAANIHLTGAIHMPANWESGSSILIYSNSDGSTQEGMPYFTGSNFLASHVGKWLTVWKSGSVSTDDSIYLITQLYGPPGTLTSSVIGVDNNMGCTPFTGSLKPAFTARTNINYRVVDFSFINSITTFNSFHYIVLQMNGAPYVNAGQHNSQVRLRLASLRTQFVTNDFAARGVAIKLIPSGTYVGTGSNDGITGGNSYQGGNPATLTNIGEFGPNSGHPFDWNSGGGGTQCINIAAAQDFFTFFAKGGFASSGCGFHVEIPQRLYPFQYDPDPMCGMGIGYDMYMGFTDGYGYGFGFYMVASDNKPYKHWLAVKHMGGDFYNTHAANNMGAYTNGIYNHMWFNPFTNKFQFTDAILGTNQPAPGHYLARARLRRVRFIGPIIPVMQRLGDRGEWLHVRSGICWPWDNAILPASIFRQGY